MPSVAYTPRDPSASALYQVVRDHLETFPVEAAASVTGLVSHGRERRRPHRLGAPPATGARPASPTCQAQADGFDLHAGVRIPAGHRDRLERVCRYVLRPPLAETRLAVLPTGEVALQLRHPWTDGTTHVVFTPTAWLARLAVLVPRPRINLVLYAGVLAPRSAWRPEVVPEPAASAPDPVDAPVHAWPRTGRGWRWADLMRRVFAVDVLACPACGGRLRLVATLEASDTTRRILRHLHLPTDVPPPAPPRAPPTWHDTAA